MYDSEVWQSIKTFAVGKKCPSCYKPQKEQLLWLNCKMRLSSVL
jgi:hypothetical protein